MNRGAHVQLDRVVLRMVRACLTTPFENRWQRFESWTKVLVQVDAEGVSGFGECTAMETPYYNYETVETAWHILERYLVPAVLRSGSMDGYWDMVDGHHEAKGALECAMWDLRARVAGRALCEELGGTARPVRAAATVGIEPSIEALVAAVARVHDAGYGRVRIKIRPGWDVEPLRAACTVSPDMPVIADANGAYDASDLAHLRCLDDLGLFALEQPFPRRALELSASLQKAMRTPICLDESVQDRDDAERAARVGACQLINVKVGRVGGLAEAIRIHDFCRAHGIANFVGAKYELGVGRWTNLALSVLPNMTVPSDVGPAGRYYRDDGTDRSVGFSTPGWVEPLAAPGIGVTPTNGVETVRMLTLTARGSG